MAQLDCKPGAQVQQSAQLRVKKPKTGSKESILAASRGGPDVVTSFQSGNRNLLDPGNFKIRYPDPVTVTSGITKQSYSVPTQYLLNVSDEINVPYGPTEVVLQNETPYLIPYGTPDKPPLRPRREGKSPGNRP
jgi:hypothetical protein